MQINDSNNNTRWARM